LARLALSEKEIALPGIKTLAAAFITATGGTFRIGESAMSRGRPLAGAPGWRVTERPERYPWRAGYVIVPAALIVGALQMLTSSHRDGSEDRHQAVASAIPSSPAAKVAGTPRAERSEERALPPFGTLVSGGGAAFRPAPDAAGAVQISVLHAAGSENALAAMQLAAYLQARGFAVTDIRPVDAPIEEPRVRYFFEGDQPDSARLVEAIRTFFAKSFHQAPRETLDFGHVSPGPQRGHVEVWLPNSGRYLASS
jgi:hypothetical protein